MLEILIRISSGTVDGGPQVLSESEPELVEQVSYSWENNDLGRIALSTVEPTLSETCLVSNEHLNL